MDLKEELKKIELEKLIRDFENHNPYYLQSFFLKNKHRITPDFIKIMIKERPYMAYYYLYDFLTPKQKDLISRILSPFEDE